MKRTPLDDEFEKVLDECADALNEINQKAIKDEQPDIKSQSCHLIEIIDTLLSNRREE
jgi:hypothetical protein